MGTYIYPFIDNSGTTFTGGIVTGDTYFVGNLSGGTFYSGATLFENIFLTSGTPTGSGFSLVNYKQGSLLGIKTIEEGSNITILDNGDSIVISATSVSSTFVQPGLNTYTAGTVYNPTINVSALTINTITASGNSVFTGSLSGGSAFSAATIYSASTNIETLFSHAGHTHQFSTILNTAHTHSVANIDNLSNLLDTKVNKSGDTMTGGLVTPSLSATTLSGGTIYSASTNIETLFSHAGHTHQFSTILNTAHTHSVANIDNLSNLLDTKVNKSGDTMTGGLVTPSLSATTLSGGTIYSGNTNIQNIFVISGITLGSGTPVFVDKNESYLRFRSLSAGTNVSLSTDGNVIVISSADGSSGRTETYVQPGLNTYTGGTISNPTVNVSALTIASISVSGNTILSGASASSLNIYSLSGSGTLMLVTDNSGNVSAQAIPVVGQSTIVRNGLNTYTAGTTSDYSVNVSALTINTITASGNSVFTGSLSGGSAFSAATIYSASTNIETLFSHAGHTHQFSTILNTAHTHSVANIDNLSNLLDTKVNKSGDTMTGGLVTPSLSATTLSGGTIYSASTNLEEIFLTPSQVVWEYQPNYNSFRTKNSSNNVYAANSFAAGISNTISITSSKSVILNGNSNSISSGNNGRYISILNGKNNIINIPEVYSGIYSLNGILQRYGSGIIVGGKHNNTNGIYSTIVNGIGNIINTVSGGNAYNFISNTILNGYQNNIKNNSSYSTITNGLLNIVNDTSFSTIDSSKNSKIYFSQYSFINTGIYNSIYDSTSSSIFASRNTILSGCNYTVAIGLENYNNNSNNVNNTLITNNLLILNTGSSNVFSTVSLSAITIQSNNLTGATIQMVVADSAGVLSTYPIPSAGQSTIVRNGLNTYTAGTTSDYSVNVSALTINTITASGNSVFTGSLSGGSSFSASTIYSASTNLGNLFVCSGRTIGPGTGVFVDKTEGNILQFKGLSAGTNISFSVDSNSIAINASGGSGGGSSVDNGINTFTAGTSTFQSVNVTGLSIANLIASGNTSLQAVSATTISSGNTNLNSLFAHSAHTHVGGIGFTIDNGASVITTGFKGYVIVPYNAIINSWTIVANTSGSIEIDVWKDTYANYPPTIADTITGTEKISLSSQEKNQDLSLTSWNTTLSSGDILAFNVDSVSTVSRVTVMINTIKLN